MNKFLKFLIGGVSALSCVGVVGVACKDNISNVLAATSSVSLANNASNNTDISFIKYSTSNVSVYEGAFMGVSFNTNLDITDLNYFSVGYISSTGGTPSSSSYVEISQIDFSGITDLYNISYIFSESYTMQIGRRMACKLVFNNSRSSVPALSTTFIRGNFDNSQYYDEGYSDGYSEGYKGGKEYYDTDETYSNLIDSSTSGNYDLIVTDNKTITIDSVLYNYKSVSFKFDNDISLDYPLKSLNWACLNCYDDSLSVSSGSTVYTLSNWSISPISYFDTGYDLSDIKLQYDLTFNKCFDFKDISYWFNSYGNSKYFDDDYVGNSNYDYLYINITFLSESNINVSTSSPMKYKICYYDNDYTLTTNSHYYLYGVTNNNVGFSDGYNEGYGIGYNEGEGIGYSNAYYEFYFNRYNEGYNIGYNAGLNDNDGYNKGYNAGYDTGLDDGEELGGTGVHLYNLIRFIPDQFVGMLKQMINFEFLGINVFDFVASLFTIMLVFAIIKRYIH